MTSSDDQSGPDGQLGGRLFGGDARSADYQAWAERLRAKRDRAKKLIAENDEPSTSRDPNYWSTDALFAESRRVREHEAAAASTASEIATRKSELAIDLGMHGEINLETATDAWRRLAKLHHPDRYTEADSSTQDHHATQMVKVNSAYAALKKLLADA